MKMNIKDIFYLSVKNLLRRRTRTVLTTIGVIIGTTAIVSMFGLSIGLSKSIDVTISNLGDLTILEIYNTGVYVDDNGEYHMTSNNLSTDMVQRLRYEEGVLAVCPLMQPENCSFIVSAGPRYQIPYASIVGVDPAVLQFFHFGVSSGEMPNSDDKNFILFGSETLYQFLDPNKTIANDHRGTQNTGLQSGFDRDGNRSKPDVDVLAEEIIVQSYLPELSRDEPLRRYRFNKVGVLETDPTDQSNEYLVFMSAESVREMVLEQERLKHTAPGKSEANSYNVIKVKARNIEAADKITDTLSAEGIAIYGLSDYRKEMISSKNSIETILRFIGLMALFVSMIGISNTTIMSVYERTSEIGIMKVLGCPIWAICEMFLLESAVIGLIGGFIGSLLSVCISIVINNIPNWNIISGLDQEADISVIPFYLIAIAIAILFSTLTGLLAGAIPARRATKIDVLEAIKNIG